jgi:hypothetical protein
MARTLSRSVRRLSSPGSWAIRTRQLFLVTAPVSVPCWLVAALLANFALAVQQASLPLINFWNAPPKRVPSDSYTSYRSRTRNTGEVVELPLPGTARDAA